MQKNFIAFTLSEMMIVLLIISVISAATLPAITQRNEIKPANAGSVWWYDNKYTKGYFYANDANTDVLIGYNIKGYIPANKNTVASYFGYSALKLGRSAPSDNFLYASQGRSDIAFFNKDRIYQGKIAADTRGNIAMGRLTSNNNQSALNSYGNLFIGSYAGYSVATSSEQKYNTIVGTYALSNNGMYTYAGTNNVIIAPKATGTSPQDRNVIIGYGATFNSITSTLYDKKYNNTVSIGAFSSSNAIYAQSNVNVGFYAGARPTQNTADNVGNGYNNFVNIGHYAGYNAGTGHNSYSNINIGNFSGSNNNTTHGNTLNIGSYAGYLSKSYNTVNIGKYAAYSQTFDNIGYGSVNIGAYSAMHSNINSPMDNVNIGYYAGYASINNRNVNIGNYAAKSATHLQDSVSIGNYANYSITSSQESVSIGEYSIASGSSFSTYIGNNISGNVPYSIIVGCYGLSYNASG
ncbi:prepilin-type N-terminal cleavage/methylation domain-containing protein, partial [bacterium]|nr:prepilin-type N-terminal cleavage/methylation domain-containing protein [bacterium]